MAEQDQVSVDSPSSIPTLNDLQSQQMSGLVNPFTIEPSKLDLPQPPRSYPVNVPASNLIPTQKGNSDYDQMFNNLIQSYSDTSWADDPTKYSQAESYNADYDGANFERYYKVGNVFKDKGFSPYRDNEKIYDENATWFDYYKRSLGAMGSGFVNGFTDMLPWNSWSSDVTDIEAAKNMERAHAIGHDNRGGFGSFMNNMTVDFGYTGGILAEFAAEELVMWAGAALTGIESGGTTVAGAGVETVSQFAKLKKLLGRAMDLKTYGKTLDKTYDWIRNADKMRDIYSAAKTGAGKLGKGLANAIVPETFKYADEMMELGRKGDLVFDMAKTAKGFGALYRDARRVSASVSESAMEGGSAELEVRKRLADEIYSTGRAPSEEEWTDIYAKAADAGKETFWWNLPALYASNAIVFDKAFKGFKPLNAFREELEAGIKGKLKYNEAWKAAGQKAWEVVDTGFKDTAKSLFKASTYKPKNLIGNVLSKFVNYTQANLAEGFQEVYQDAVQKTMTDYYMDQFHHPALSGARSTWGAFADNAGMLNPFGESSQTFLSGFLMGSMATAPQKVAFEWIPKKFYQYTDPAGFAEYQDNLKRHTNSVVDALNAATMDEKFFDDITTNASSQLNLKKEAEEANMAGDKKAFYTITDNAVAEHMHTLISTGKINLIRDQLKDMKQLTPAELQEAFGPIDKSQGDLETFYQDKIDGMLNKIDLVEKHTERVNKRFPNPFNPAGVSKKKDPETWATVNEAYKSFELAKKAAIMSSYNFDRTVQRIQSITNKLLKDYDTIFTGPNMQFTQTMGKANASTLGSILNVNSIDSMINVLKGEVDVYSKGDPESQKKGEASKQELEDLENLRNSIKEVQLTSFTNKKESVDPNAKGVAETKNASKIKAGTKVKNKKGETVNVAKVKGGFAYDKAGNKIGKTKNLEIAGGEVETDDYLDVASKNLYEAYSNYIRNSAKRAGLNVHQSAIDDTFQEYKDLFLLGTDAQEYAEHVDILHNPKALLEFASRAAQALKTIREQKKALLEKSYKNFLDSLKLNDLFGEFYKMGVFLDEKGVEAILKNQVPTDFYSIADMNRISEDSPKYKEILDLLEKYEQTQDVELEEKPIEEADTQSDRGFSSARRNKINNDNRRFKDIAAQYGFNPDPNASSKVNTKEVLKKLIESPYATYREKALARRLLTVIKDDSQITFQKLPNPGLYGSFSLNEQASTFLDPRYMSKDYRGGTTPFEYVVLHELIHEVTVIGMESDKQFKDSITRLLNIARKEFQTNPPTDTTLYQTGTDKPFYGMKNEAEFLSELFTNDRFAMWLSTIQVEGTGKTAWQEFADSIRKFLKRLLGLPQNSNVLDEALYLATTFIDKTSLGPETAAEGGAKIESGETGALTKDTSIERLRTVGLLPSLVSAFREFVNSAYDTNNLEALYALNPKFADITKEKFNEFTDDQLAGLNSFKKYLGFTKPGRILAEYNRKNGFTTLEKEKEPATTTTTSKIDWNNLIDKAVSEKELDSIMDQMDKEGTMTPDFLMAINKKRDSIKSKAPVTPPVTTAPGLVPREVEARLDLVSKFGMDQAVVDKMTTPQVLAEYDAKLKSVKGTTTTDIEAKKAELEDAIKQQKEDLKKITIGTPVGGISGLNIGSRFNIGYRALVEDNQISDDFDPNIADNDGEGYTIVTKVYVYGELENSKMSKAPKIQVTTFNNKADADAYIEKQKIKIEEYKSKLGTGRRIDRIKQELAALEGKTAEKPGEQLTMDLEEKPEEEKTTTKIEKPTREQQKDLRALNFQARDYATLSRKEAQDIIDEGLKKEDRLEREEQRAIDEALKAEAEKEESAKEKENRIKQMIEAAEYLEDFKDVDAEITAAIASDPFFNTAELENLIAQRKADLAENPIFEDIKVNEIIQLNNKSKVIVLKKTAKTIQVRKASDITAKTFTINIKQFDKDTRDTKKPYVTMRIEPGSEIVSTETVVSTEDAETITENFKNATSATDEEELREDINLGKKLSAAERRNNIINNIKSCGL